MSVDLKSPTGRRARKIRAARGPVKEYRCQFCGEAALIEEWTKNGYDHCPNCGKPPDLVQLGI
jgi:NAD-dependent SIR2 family protein deacetylase